ncbi:MAG: winged helix-turn-helix domain-containing protein [Rickettsiales bacterium]|jgi:transposase|nr:winged helix-turn-helix domain-containing protein [Rickettsiales bacterium]
MSKSYIPDSKLVEFAFKTIKSADLADDLKRGLCVVLGSEADLTTDLLAQCLCISRRTVFRYRDELDSLMHGEEDPRDKWGGRRNSILTEKEEKNFLTKWETKALRGELTDAKVIRNDLSEVVGHSVALSTVYNLLGRNSWRKLKPDTCHPKSDPAVREELKKNPRAFGIHHQRKKYRKVASGSILSGLGKIR